MGTVLCGLSSEQFWKCRVKDFFLILEEYQEQRKQEFQQRAELVRLQTATLVNVQLKKEDQVKPTELWHFDWDEKTTATDTEDDNMTDEQIQAHNARLASML